MRFYHMGWREVMNLPIGVFWSLNEYLERIRAEEDLHQFQASSFAQGGEGTAEYAENLTKRIGKTFTVDPVVTAVRDEDGFGDLRAMAKQMTG